MPVGEGLHMPSQPRLDVGDGLANRGNALGMQLLVMAFGKDEARLPVVRAVQHNKSAATPDTAEQSTREIDVLWQFCQTEPEQRPWVAKS